MPDPAFRRPLLATEHTPFDVGAERVGLALAARARVPLAVVLPLVSNPEYELVAPQLAERANAQAAAALREIGAAAAAAGVAVAPRVRRGAELDAEILDEAAATGADLIVIRRRGKRGFLARALVGEMVTRVVTHARCSVLVAPRDVQLWHRRVLAAVDPLAADSAPLVAAALRVARDADLPLAFVCVALNEGARPVAEAALARALAAARAEGRAADGAVRIGKPFEHVMAAARDSGADLVVVARHGGALVDRAWLGGTAQKVIGLAECPVLVAIG